MRQTVYSNLNFLLNTTLERGCRNISSLGKLSYGDLFVPITLFISESPHLTGSFKLRANGRNVGSCWPTMLLQQCCVRFHVASKALKCSNKTANIGAKTSLIHERDVHAERNTDQHFDTMSLMYSKKNRGPRIEPRGTPQEISILNERWPLYSTYYFLFEK